MTKVAVTICQSYDQIKAKINHIFNLHGGLHSFIKKNDKILLKPNLLVSRKNPSDPSTTDPKFIIALAEIVNDFGARVFIGDSPAFGTSKAILKKLGLLEQLSYLGVEIVEFNRPIKRFASYTLDQASLDYDHIFNLPKLKVHSQLLLSMAVKNLFGFVTGKRKPLLHFIHGDRLNHFAEMLVKNYDSIQPSFTILDAVVAMNKDGPKNGEAKKLGLIFSGVDCVAIDRVVVEVLGVPFEQYLILKAAKKLNIGEWRLNNIEVLAENSLPKISLDYPLLTTISFSPYRIVKSTIKNWLIKRKQQK